MLFSSSVFLFAYLPIVLVVYYIPLRGLRRAQNLFLLAASLLFYAWGEPWFVLVMAASIAANYGFGLWVHARLCRCRSVRLPVAAAAVCNLGLLFVLSNYLILFGQMFPGLPLWGNLAVLALLTLWYIGFQIVPWRTDRQLPRRLKIMMGGRELYLTAALWAAAEGAFVLAMLGRLEGEQALALVANALMALPVLALAAINGFVRLMLTSARLRLVLRVLLLLFWWFPVVNLVLIARACALVKAEYRFELVRLERNEEREESQVCQTRYPILLVHGIFFRDWQIINYWGRIPGELIRNGAQIFYGGQQSAAPVSRSAARRS